MGQSFAWGVRGTYGRIQPASRDVRRNREKGDTMTDKVWQNKERFDRKVEDARNHPDLSAEAERRNLSEAYAQAKAEHVRLCVEHKESRRSIADLERKVFEVNMPLSVSPYEKETFRMSYRDAYDRAERIASSVELPQRAEALKSRLFGWVGPRKPHELGGSVPGPVGQGIGDMHGDRSPGGGFSETG
jgi:hypothetical protein